MESKKERDANANISALVGRFIAGDNSAYAEIYRLYAGDMYSFGLSLHAGQEFIEDSIHDIFVELFAHREKLAGIRNVRLYLIVAFKNRLFYLQKKSQITVEIADRYSQFYAERDYVDTLIEREESVLERERLVKRLLSELNMHQQEVVYHRFIEGFSIEEIALLMNINPQSVKNLLHRSLKKIRAAGLLSDEDCRAFSSVYVKQIVDAVQDDDFAVILHNCGNTGQCTGAMVSTGAKGYHFGNRIDLVQAAAECPPDVLVMGNLDPVGVFRSASAGEVKRLAAELLERMRPYPNFVLSSGCDTPPEVPFENIEAFYSAL